MESTSESRQRGDDEGVVERGVRILREEGYRLTAQRRAVLEYFGRRAMHSTAQEIVSALRDRDSSLSQATVYNSLEVFEELGLLRKICCSDGNTYYDPALEPHHHAICSKCGTIVDLPVDDDALERLVGSAAGPCADADFQLRDASVWFRGVCHACREE